MIGKNRGSLEWTDESPYRRRLLAAAAALGLVGLAFLAGPLGGDAQASGNSGGAPEPADKIAVAAASFEILSAPVVDGARSQTVELFRAPMKTSSPTDLIMGVQLECALWTDVTVVGNGESEAVATVKVWIELDGARVPVSSDDTRDAGKVVFCNRAFKMAVTNVDDEDATFQQFLSTRSANGFTWITLNVGSYPKPHEIVVKAQLESQVTGTGQAYAGIGKRTLIVEPVKLANDAAI